MGVYTPFYAKELRVMVSLIFFLIFIESMYVEFFSPSRTCPSLPANP